MTKKTNAYKGVRRPSKSRRKPLIAGRTGLVVMESLGAVVYFQHSTHFGWDDG